MAYGTPSDPVAGTVITVAYAKSNILDPLRWLRLMTGNADPPGSSYVVVSDSTTGTTWRKVPADALAAGAAAGNLGYTPANKNGDTFTGAIVVPSPLTVQKIDDAGNGGRIILKGSSGFFDIAADASGNFLRIYNVSDPTKIVLINLTTGVLASSGAMSATQFVSSIPDGTVPLIVASGTQVTNFNASKVVGRAPGTGAGDIAFYNGSGRVAFAAIADLAGDSNQLGGKVLGTGAGTVAFYDVSGRVAIASIADLAGNSNQLGGKVLGTTAGTVAFYDVSGRVAFASIADLAGNSNQVGGLTPTATPAAGAIPKADGSGKLATGWIPSAVGAPLVGEIRGYGGSSMTAPNAAGWYLCDGTAKSRTTFSALFAIVGTTYGAGDGSTTFNLPDLRGRMAMGVSGSHGIGTTGGAETVDDRHTHSGAALGVGGNTGPENSDNGLGNGGGTSVPIVGHTHGSGTLDVTGSTDSGGTAALAILSPFLAVNHIIYAGV